MARSCPNCGKYLGAALSCPNCTGRHDPADSPTHRRVTPPLPQAPSRPAPADQPGRATSGVPRAAKLFSVRGEVVACNRVAASWALGVLAVRLPLWLATVALLTIKGRDFLVQQAVGLLLTFLPLILLALAGWWLLGKLRLDGCLGTILGAGVRAGVEAGSAFACRSRPGWELVVEHPGGREHVRVAASAPFEEGQIVQVHGPRLGRRRDAWLVQALSPGTFTRIGRGLVSTVVQLAVLLPLCGWLLTW